MADDDRRAGDWQKRDLRKNANDLIEEPNQKAWCKQTFWIVFFLIVFWPVGIVLCWRSSWHIVAKVLASVAVAFMVYFSVTMYQATHALWAAGWALVGRAARFATLCGRWVVPLAPARDDPCFFGRRTTPVRFFAFRRKSVSRMFLVRYHFQRKQ